MRKIDRIEIINPATEEVIDEAWRGTVADVDIVVKVAKAAQASWKKVPGVEKTSLMHEAVAKMSSNARDELRQAEFDKFCQVKHVHWNIEGKIKKYWFPHGKNN